VRACSFFCMNNHQPSDQDITNRPHHPNNHT
jgi:hypothetical protein